MIKIIGCLFIIVSTSCAGYMLGDKLRKRVADLKELQRILISIKNELKYSIEPIELTFKKIARDFKNPYDEILRIAAAKIYNNEITSIDEAISEALAEKEMDLALKDEDKLIFTEFARSLGKWNIGAQEDFFNLSFVKIEEQLNSAEDFCAKNLKMYNVMGPCIGLMLVIVLI
ncbi:stage III sporulation protein AB [Clostridium cellulovorans]|uniref:Sporulation stage III protein AB n=1 Tax=Clostridium cellulovorans (strain ATCC 35296 / DSM 3052 / OCM 3 / 743B) TaxID=573061 RepID=D9SLF2_CLOC7|nr:stage III sporulation protein AB [Clostridium cellulovorans]ADL51668.1 Sporulation stage III protein AB [Clostridium cellulovorans 743B]